MSSRVGDKAQWVAQVVNGLSGVRAQVRWWDGKQWGRSWACGHEHRTQGPAQDCAGREARRRNRVGEAP